MVVRLNLRLLAPSGERDDHRDFITMVVRLNLKIPGHIQRDMSLEILQISTGRLRFTGVVELLRHWALGRRLQRRLRWRAATSTTHSHTERVQARMSQHVVWQMWAYNSKRS